MSKGVIYYWCMMTEAKTMTQPPITVWWEYGRMDVGDAPFIVRHRLTLCGGITVRDHGDCWGARDSARIAREYGIQWPEVQ